MTSSVLRPTNNDNDVCSTGASRMLAASSPPSRVSLDRRRPPSARVDQATRPIGRDSCERVFACKSRESLPSIPPTSLLRPPPRPPVIVSCAVPMGRRPIPQTRTYRTTPGRATAQNICPDILFDIGWDMRRPWPVGAEAATFSVARPCARSLSGSPRSSTTGRPTRQPRVTRRFKSGSGRPSRRSSDDPANPPGSPSCGSGSRRSNARSTFRRRSRLVAALVVLIAALVPIPLAGATSTSGLTYVAAHGCSGGPALAPATIDISCASGDQFMTGIVLTGGGWGAGTLHTNTCKPFCAAGNIATQATAFLLTSPVRCSDGRTYYAFMRWAVLLHGRDIETETASIAPEKGFAGISCAKPTSQTKVRMCGPEGVKPPDFVTLVYSTASLTGNASCATVRSVLRAFLSGGGRKYGGPDAADTTITIGPWRCGSGTGGGVCFEGPRALPTASIAAQQVPGKYQPNT